MMVSRCNRRPSVGSRNGLMAYIAHRPSWNTIVEGLADFDRTWSLRWSRARARVTRDSEMEVQFTKTRVVRIWWITSFRLFRSGSGCCRFLLGLRYRLAYDSSLLSDVFSVLSLRTFAVALANCWG